MKTEKPKKHKLPLVIMIIGTFVAFTSLWNDGNSSMILVIGIAIVLLGFFIEYRLDKRDKKKKEEGEEDGDS